VGRIGEVVTREVLQGFLEAFNNHDLDATMGYFDQHGKIRRKNSVWKILE
jgi:hypothetical protein